MRNDTNLREQRIRVLPFAASDREAEAPFYVIQADYCAETDRLRRGMSSLYRRGPQYPLSDIVQVRTVRLDRLLAQERLADRPLALWIDAEGMAYEVIRGAEGVLAHTCLLHVEVETMPCIGANQHLFADVLHCIESRGFALVATDQPRGHSSSTRCTCVATCYADTRCPSGPGWRWRGCAPVSQGSRGTSSRRASGCDCNKIRDGATGSMVVNAEVAGAEYVEAMNRDPADREYRRAFLSLALTLVPPRGSVFDFGSGPGIDAKHYAEAGLRVGAYDVSSRMCEYFAQHCAAEIAAGSVQLMTGEYSEFLNAQPAGGTGVDLIVANFGPLNLVPDLPPLFAKFAVMLNAEGKLLVSILNPFHGPLLRLRGWWARLPLLLGSGRFTIRPPNQPPVTRWLPHRFGRRAAPWFDLTAIYAPQVARPGEAPRRVSMSLDDWRSATLTQFLFLQFQRRAPT